MEPLDRIYALLGLVGEEYRAIIPDYKADLLELLAKILQTQYNHVSPHSLDEVDEHCRTWSEIFPHASTDTTRASRLQWAADNHILDGLRLTGIYAQPAEAWTELCSFANHHNIAAMQVILNNSTVDINGLDTSSHAQVQAKPRDGLGMTPLHVACQSGHQTVVSWLLERPMIHTDCHDHNGMAPLHLACQAGHQKIVELLLSRLESQVNDRSRSGMIPPHIACQSGHQNIVELLLRIPDAEVNCGDAFGTTALHIACKSGHETIVNLLLDRPEIAINARGILMATALHLACQEGHYNIVQVLLRLGGLELNARDCSEKTPLHYAASHSRSDAGPKVLDLLLHQPNIKSNAVDSAHQTALHLTVLEFDTYAPARALVLARSIWVDTNICDDRGRNALHIAVCWQVPLVSRARNLSIWESRESMIQTLLQRKEFEVNRRDAQGATALHYAVGAGAYSFVELILERLDADVNIPDRSGRTVLHRAAVADGVGLLKRVLRRANVDLNAREIENKTALQLAARSGRFGVIILLLENRNVDVDIAWVLSELKTRLRTDYFLDKLAKILEEREKLKEDGTTSATELAHRVRERFFDIGEQLESELRPETLYVVT